jgi:hypothetical protein
MTANPDTTELSNDGAWCWFQDPRAVRHVGRADRTYTGWVTRGGDIEVASYDHATGDVERTTLHADFEEDDHDAPSVYVDEDDRLLVFYTAHGGPEIHYRRSAGPEDVTSFEPARTIAPSGGHTYPNPRRLGDELFLFYRNGNGSLSFVTSGDDGRTWSEERELVTTGGRDWCVYFKISAVRDGTVDAGLTYAQGGRHEPHRHVRHARFDGRELRTADGDAVGGDGEPTTIWETPSVYDSDDTGHDAWIWDCSATDGVPELVYAELRSQTDHAYRYARWTGEGWRDVPLADAGSHIVEGNDETYYSGGVYLDHERTGVCYLSVGDHANSVLERAETVDGGESWETTTVADGGGQNVRPVVPRNRSDDLPVLWMRGSYTYYANREYDTGIVGPADGRRDET